MTAPRHRWSFTLRTLFVAVTMLAILAALYRVAPKEIELAVGCGVAGAVAIGLGKWLRRPGDQLVKGIRQRGVRLLGAWILLWGFTYAINGVLVFCVAVARAAGYSNRVSQADRR